jgi:hypothetical protein
MQSIFTHINAWLLVAIFAAHCAAPLLLPWRYAEQTVFSIEEMEKEPVCEKEETGESNKICPQRPAPLNGEAGMARGRNYAHSAYWAAQIYLPIVTPPPQGNV